MASITNASNAYVSTGNGNAYQITSNKIYSQIAYSNGLTNTDAYYTIDGSGNFSLHGVMTVKYAFASITISIPVPIDWNANSITFSNATMTNSENNSVVSFPVETIPNPSGYLVAINNANWINNLNAGTYSLLVTGTVQPPSHII